MILKLYESTEINKAKVIEDTIEFYLNKYSDLFSEEGMKRVILDSIKTNISILPIKNNTFLDDIYTAIVLDYDYDSIIEMLNRNGIVFYSLGIHAINYGKKNYNLIKDINTYKEIYFNCNKNNLLEVLSLCERINTPIILDGTSISLEDYQEILEGYDLNKISNKKILVRYQEYGTEIDINTLYNTSCQVNYITKKIKKYNLSPLEKTMLVYDIVKNNSYHKEGEKDSYLVSRTLDNVLNSEYIVCAGYAAIINAMLKNLNINAEALICQTKNEKHCRSIIYLKDDKYNIDGIYVLDPTWDSKRSNGKRIDKYNYFLLPLEVAEKTASSEMKSITKLSLDDLILLENNDINKNMEELVEIHYYIEKLFKLMNNNNYESFKEYISFYEFLSNDDITRLKYIYNDFSKKCKVRDISLDSFIRALYNVKRIEYYIGDDKIPSECSSRLEIPNTDNIDILNIKYSTLTRYCKIKTLMNGNRRIDDITQCIGYESFIDRYISSNIGNIISSDNKDGIKRDMLNMKLLKLLKKEKVRKEIDNK